jgi:hypothetical protein
MLPTRMIVGRRSVPIRSLRLCLHACLFSMSATTIWTLGLAGDATANPQAVLPVHTIAAPSSATPVITASFEGYSSDANSPPDTTLAASPTEAMEVLNEGYLITNRNGEGTSGTLAQLVGTSGVYLSDPQVMWDPVSSRFSFSVYENRGKSKPNEGLVWGFSKTATPTSPTDFCTYFAKFGYGAKYYPDRESLGDTTDFLLIGDDRISTETGAWVSSDLVWITKPPAGNTCPTKKSFKKGKKLLTNTDGTLPDVPVPSRQVDSSGTGWILAAPSVYLPESHLTLVRVSEKPTGGLAIAAPANVPVPEYVPPPYAVQAGQTIAGDPAPGLETRVYLTQVIMAFDPRLGHTVLWTAHTIAGGAGAQVRWYEIDPATQSVDQEGTISDPTLYVFNATVSPDRIVNGAGSAFGEDAVIDVNTSSASSYPAIRMVGVTGGQPQSALVLVKQSFGPNVDFSCFNLWPPVCRWGDYSAAAPDPGASTTGASGDVWLANQWNMADINDSTPVWRTTVWRAFP